MLLTPLEQFQIISLIPLTLFGLDFSFTNLFLISLLILSFFNLLIYFSSKNNSFFVSRSIGASSAGLRHHEAMATPAMPKRIQPSKKTGIAATNGLHRAT